MTVKAEHGPSSLPHSSASPVLKWLELGQMSDSPKFSSPLDLPAASFLSSSASTYSVFERLPQLSPAPHYLIPPPALEPLLSASSSQPSAASSQPSALSLSSPSTTSSSSPPPYLSTAFVGRTDVLSVALDELSNIELMVVPPPPERDSSIFSSSSSSASSVSSALSTPRHASSPVSTPTALVSALRPKRRRPLTSELRQSAVKLEGAAEDDDSSEEEEEQHRKHRAAVVDQTVHRARELYGLVGLLSRACNRQNDNIRALTEQLQAATSALQVATQSARVTGEAPSSESIASLASSASSSLDSRLASSALNSSLLLSVRVAITVVDGMASRVLDCNAYMLESTGWERHHVIDRIIGRSYDELMDDRVWQANETVRRLTGDHVLVNGPGGTMVRAQLQEQYPSSLEKKRRLYRREVDKISALWRNQLRDGFVYEMSGVTYVSDWMDVDDRRGGLVQRPQRVVWVVPMWDARRVDNDTRPEHEPDVSDS